MLEPILLNSPTDWEQVYSETKVVSRPAGAGGRYNPIEPWFVSQLFETHILMVNTVVPNANPRWRLGCRVRQYLEPSPISGLNIQGSERNIPPNRSTLLSFPRLTEQYRLEVWVPWWHEQITVQIWQYTGTNITRLEELVTERTDVIRVDLARIETKINNLQ